MFFEKNFCIFEVIILQNNMRIYKANLDDNYDVISYDIPSLTEKVYSVREDILYDISDEAIHDYLEIAGFITTPIKEVVDKSAYLMFIDIDHQFSSVWDNDTSIYVRDQIVRSIRQNLLDYIFAEEESFLGINDCENGEPNMGIVGEPEIFLDELTYVYHKYKGGVWDSSEEDIIKIDRHSGLIKGLKIGNSTVTYTVDSGAGILTCFKTITVKNF